MLIAAVAAMGAGCGLSDHTRRVSVPWSLVQSEGRRLMIEFVSGGCESFDHAGATETNQQVTVAAYDLLARKAGEACTSEVIFARSTLALRQPLGARKLMHAPVTPGLTQ